MDEIQEKVVVTVDDKNPNNPRIKIKDYDFRIKGNSSLITKKLNFIIDSLIITTNKNCNIIIKFFEIDIDIFNIVDIKAGSHYIPLRITPIDINGKQFNFSPQKWLINNKLEINVIGPKDVAVDITMRC